MREEEISEEIYQELYNSNIGGSGISEKEKMVFYLYGNQTTYPNLRLSLWTKIEEFNKTTFGKPTLQGDLELRVKDWIDFDEETGEAYDDRLIEMGWMFKKYKVYPEWYS